MLTRWGEAITPDNVRTEYPRPADPRRQDHGRSATHDEELNDPWYGGEHPAYSWTQGAFMHFALYPSRVPQRPVTVAAQVGFHVSNFDAVHTRVVQSGTPVVQAPRNEPWGKTARYLDPDGNIVSITANQ